MGACMSAPAGVEVSEQDRILHREAEKQLKEAKAKMASQVKVLLLGSGDSGKSTILKQMRLIHKVPFSAQEIEHYRQLVFDNLTRGLRYLLDAMEDMELSVSDENLPHLEMIDGVRDIRDGEPFPMAYYEPLKSLWEDPNVQKAWARGNEAALPENLSYFYEDLDRLFNPEYQPTEQDIIRCRARTIGITETTFTLREHEMLMVDVGGQKSERRKWIHCFQDVTSILFLVSLSGYDQCLVEDKDANQMQDAMTIWDSICHSQWFKQTSIILFLNKNDLFEKKIPSSDIKNFFPDFEGEPGDVRAGREYFKRRFARLAQKAGRSKEREIYIHITTATDTALLRVVMAAVEDPGNNAMKPLESRFRLRSSGHLAIIDMDPFEDSCSNPEDPPHYLIPQPPSGMDQDHDGITYPAVVIRLCSFARPSSALPPLQSLCLQTTYTTQKTTLPIYFLLIMIINYFNNDFLGPPTTDMDDNLYPMDIHGQMKLARLALGTVRCCICGFVPMGGMGLDLDLDLDRKDCGCNAGPFIRGLCVAVGAERSGEGSGMMNPPNAVKRCNHIGAVFQMAPRCLEIPRQILSGVLSRSRCTSSQDTAPTHDTSTHVAGSPGF